MVWKKKYHGKDYWDTCIFRKDLISHNIKQKASIHTWGAIYNQNVTPVAGKIDQMAKKSLQIHPDLNCLEKTVTIYQNNEI